MGPSGKTIEASLNKRINAVIATLMDIEKTQTKPTTAMLRALFEGGEGQERKPRLRERKDTTKTIESELAWLRKLRNPTDKTETP